jgi:hypothetical protein
MAFTAVIRSAQCCLAIAAARPWYMLPDSGGSPTRRPHTCGGDSTGIVVCSIDTDDYTPEFPRDQWGYPGTGVMIQFTNYGLVHYTEPDEDFEFPGRASPDR